MVHNAVLHWKYNFFLFGCLINLIVRKIAIILHSGWNYHIRFYDSWIKHDLPGPRIHTPIFGVKYLTCVVVCILEEIQPLPSYNLTISRTPSDPLVMWMSFDDLVHRVCKHVYIYDWVYVLYIIDRSTSWHSIYV